MLSILSLNDKLGSLSAGKPRSIGGSERVQLSGVFNVRKGKLALPVNRWSKRQVTLSGTCLIVSSVKHAHTGKMHILPLIGGKVHHQRSAQAQYDLARVLFCHLNQWDEAFLAVGSSDRPDQ